MPFLQGSHSKYLLYAGNECLHTLVKQVLLPYFKNTTGETWEDYTVGSTELGV